MANEKKGLVDITTGQEINDANANGILDLTVDEISQLANIGTTSITAGAWVGTALLNGITSISTGTGDNDKLVTQGYVDDAISGENIWNRVSTTVSLVNSGDTINITGSDMNVDNIILTNDSGRYIKSDVDDDDMIMGAWNTFARGGYISMTGADRLINPASVEIGCGDFSQVTTDGFVTIGHTSNGAINYIADFYPTYITLRKNVTIGIGEAGVDYTLTFNGENNDGVITWDEDSNLFIYDKQIRVGSDSYNAPSLFRAYTNNGTDNNAGLLIKRLGNAYYWSAASNVYMCIGRGGTGFTTDAELEANSQLLVGATSTRIKTNTIIGNGAAGVDYTLTFDGETNDGVITWQEDEDTFDMSCNLVVNGNLGIGISIPQHAVHIKSPALYDGAFYALHLQNPTNIDGGQDSVGIVFAPEVNNDYAKGALVYERTESFARGKFHFLQKDDAAFTGYPDLSHSVMTIDNDGNVGIGTTTPEQKLHIKSSTNGVNAITEGIGLGKSVGGDYCIQITSVSGIPHIDFSNGTSEDYDARMILDNSSYFSFQGSINWGFGTATPPEKLSVYGNLNVDNASNTAAIFGPKAICGTDDLMMTGNRTRYNSGARDFYISSGGIVCVNTITAGARQFNVSGSAGGSTAWYNDSDERLKTEIQTIPNALDRVMKLRGVEFEWIDKKDHAEGKQFGFIAQESEDIIPEVIDHKGEYYAMQYALLTAILTEAIKELKKEIDSLKQKINSKE